MLLARLLPFVESVEVHLLGSGLPSFWVLRAGPVTLTLGLSGFTAANWSQAVSFDLLLPRARAGRRPRSTRCSRTSRRLGRAGARRSPTRPALEGPRCWRRCRSAASRAS